MGGILARKKGEREKKKRGIEYMEYVIHYINHWMERGRREKEKRVDIRVKG